MKRATYVLIDAQRAIPTSADAAALAAPAAINAIPAPPAGPSAHVDNATPQPPPRRSSRGSQRSALATQAKPAPRRQQQKPAEVDIRISLQIINESNAGLDRWSGNPLRPRYHNVDLEQLNKAALALKQAIGSTPLDKLRVQVSSAFCEAKKLPKASLSLGVIRRSSRTPPAVDPSELRAKEQYLCRRLCLVRQSLDYLSRQVRPFLRLRSRRAIVPLHLQPQVAGQV